MEFTGKLGKYKIIETEDQTKTLWSEYFDEACHNLSGAYNETLHNYIHGCHLPEQMDVDKKLHVLDVGFGLGVGLRAVIDEMKKHSYATPVLYTYVSMELDEDLFLWSVKTNFPEYTFIKKDNFYAGEFLITPESTLKVMVFIGDGRITIPAAFKQNLLPEFTAVFQDAFSPKKNPALWTVEWFDTLRDLSSEDVYMSTYSASVSIRKSMIKAGWKISSVKGFGTKRTMTKARLTGNTAETLAAELSRTVTLELHDT